MLNANLLVLVEGGVSAFDLEHVVDELLVELGVDLALKFFFHISQI